MAAYQVVAADRLRRRLIAKALGRRGQTCLTPQHPELSTT